MTGKRVAILGGGNMGNAIARAIRENEGSIDIAFDAVVIAEPDAGKHAALSAGGGCTVVASSSEAMRALADDGLIVIAVKPQVFGTLACEVGDVGDRLVISIMAGCPAARVQRELGGRCRVVRVMPNLPVTVGRGMTGISAGPGATQGDSELVLGLFACMGRCINVPESMMDAFTAVASSGPAYVFYLAEAMTRAAIDVGFDPETAFDIVKQTMLGAAQLLQEGPAAPDELRRRVTSKGGTTQAATEVLDQACVAEAFVRAIRAARDRGRELSQS